MWIIFSANAILDINNGDKKRWFGCYLWSDPTSMRENTKTNINGNFIFYLKLHCFLVSVIYCLSFFFLGSHFHFQHRSVQGAILGGCFALLFFFENDILTWWKTSGFQNDLSAVGASDKSSVVRKCDPQWIPVK